MLDDVLGFVDMIENLPLREKVMDFLSDPPGELGVSFLPLEICPGGAYQHHSYIGGLLEHTTCVVRISLTLCELVEDYYKYEVDRDVVLAGAILHDLMKCYCYEWGEDGRFRTSDFGDRVDHLTLMVGELMRREFPLEVVHVVAGHHGEVGATKPRNLEALIVSLADLVDSNLNGKLLRAAEYLLRRMGIAKPLINSGSKAVEIVTIKDREGWEGLRRFVERKD